MADVELADGDGGDPFEEALQRHNEYLVMSRLPPGMHPQGLDVSAIFAVVGFLSSLVTLYAGGLSFYRFASGIVQARREPPADAEPCAVPPDLDEIAARLDAGEIEVGEALQSIPEWLRPGSPAHRQVLQLAIDSGDLLRVIVNRGIPKRIATQIINETRRSL